MRIYRKPQRYYMPPNFTPNLEIVIRDIYVFEIDYCKKFGRALTNDEETTIHRLRKRIHDLFYRKLIYQYTTYPNDDEGFESLHEDYKRFKFHEAEYKKNEDKIPGPHFWVDSYSFYTYHAPYYVQKRNGGNDYPYFFTFKLRSFRENLHQIDEYLAYQYQHFYYAKNNPEDPTQFLTSVKSLFQSNNALQEYKSFLEIILMQYVEDLPTSIIELVKAWVVKTNSLPRPVQPDIANEDSPDDIDDELPGSHLTYGMIEELPNVHQDYEDNVDDPNQEERDAWEMDPFTDIPLKASGLENDMDELFDAPIVEFPLSNKTERKVIFLDKSIRPLAEFLKDYFPDNSLSELEHVLQGKKPEEKLIFRGYAYQLCGIFFQLQLKNFVIIQKKYLLEWMLDSFLYDGKSTGTGKEVTNDQLHRAMTSGHFETRKSKQIILPQELFQNMNSSDSDD